MVERRSSRDLILVAQCRVRLRLRRLQCPLHRSFPCGIASVRYPIRKAFLISPSTSLPCQTAPTTLTESPWACEGLSINSRGLIRPQLPPRRVFAFGIECALIAVRRSRIRSAQKCDKAVHDQQKRDHKDQEKGRSVRHRKIQKPPKIFLQTRRHLEPPRS
jgi:hypothetical protein